MRNKKQWYLLAYDIRNPRRLQRTYACVKKHGIRLQKSVFLLKADNQELQSLKKALLQRVHAREDDVRIYPVRHPGVLWAGGRQQIMDLYAPALPKKQSILAAGIKYLFSRSTT